MTDSFDLDVELEIVDAESGGASWVCSTSDNGGASWVCSTASTDQGGASWVCSAAAEA